jgi:hypothetical protein
LRGRELGGPNSDEGTETMVLYVRVYYNSSILDPVYASGEASEVCVTVTPGGAWAHRPEDVSCKGRIVLGIEMA